MHYWRPRPHLSRTCGKLGAQPPDPRQRVETLWTPFSQNHISKIENGEVNLQISTLIAMARSLDLELMLAPRTLVPTFQSLIKKPQREM